jgi:hypothetical protein
MLHSSMLMAQNFTFNKPCPEESSATTGIRLRTQQSLPVLGLALHPAKNAGGHLGEWVKIAHHLVANGLF